MDYDRAPPMPVDQYRTTQHAIPGLNGLYDAARAIIEATTTDGARILVVGAGGGREIESLGGSDRRFDITGVDPSADMLALATRYRRDAQVSLIKGLVDDLPGNAAFDAATSFLVMHFIRHETEKLAFLRAIRRRLKQGATYLHADLSLSGVAAFDQIAPAFIAHAKIVGLDAIAVPATAAIAAMLDGRVIGEAATAALFEASGFAPVAPFFRGLWYAGWWTRAV